MRGHEWNHPETPPPMDQWELKWVKGSKELKDRAKETSASPAGITVKSVLHRDESEGNSDLGGKSCFYRAH